MRSAEVLRRYAAGERNFRGVNLSRQSFAWQDLAEADFTGADIRSTNFTGANLYKANFSSARAGLQRRWVIPLVLRSLLFAGIKASFILSLAASLVLIFDLLLHRALPGWIWISLIFLIISLSLLCKEKYTVALATTVASTILGLYAGALAGLIAGAGKGLIAGAGVGTAFGLSLGVKFALNAETSAALSAGLLASLAIFHRLPEVVAIGNTNFTGGNLTQANFTQATLAGANFTQATLAGANFTQATLAGANFTQATLTQVNWYQVKQLDRVEFKGTMLSNPKVRDLVVTHHGANQSYKGLDLKELNLIGADLSDTDLTEADISNATLEGAWLEGVNLTKTQALGTNFRQARFTGACLEAWNIDSTTHLEEAICEYVYLLNDHKERRPNSGNFAPGEFTKLFEEVLDTIDLIFRNGVDWKAFVTSFTQVQVENEGTELTIQSIENKGDGVVVVRVNAPPETDKEKIHSDFNRNYEAELKALEEKYQAKLEAKEEQIVIYRQQSASMERIISQMASRPINITNISESKSMQDSSDINQTVSSSPDSNINAFQGNQNQVTQTQGAQAQPSQAEVIEMLAQIKALIEATELPGEVKVEANAHLKTAQKAAAQAEPKKEIALATLESMAETLEEASKTVEAGKTLWGQVKPILFRVAGWLRAAAGSSLLG